MSSPPWQQRVIVRWEKARAAMDCSDYCCNLSRISTFGPRMNDSRSRKDGYSGCILRGDSAGLVIVSRESKVPGVGDCQAHSLSIVKLERIAHVKFLFLLAVERG